MSRRSESYRLRFCDCAAEVLSVCTTPLTTHQILMRMRDLRKDKGLVPWKLEPNSSALASYMKRDGRFFSEEVTRNNTRMYSLYEGALA